MKLNINAGSVGGILFVQVAGGIVTDVVSAEMACAADATLVA